MTDGARLHLGVAIDGPGQHPAAWRLLDDDAAEVGAALRRAETYVERARRAEAGLFDFVMLDDSLVADGGRPLPLQDRLDALLTLARVAPQTTRVGLVASVNTTHTEPFNLAKNVATLDWVSLGRAGWRPIIAREDAEYAQFGRRDPAPAGTLWAEAADVVDVVGRLCDSWEDDAIIRDQATGRYIDRERVHYVDFEGPFFSVRGPSITPRSPQAQPLVVIDGAAGDVAARWADVIVVDVPTAAAGRAQRDEWRAAVAGCGRDPDQVFVMARIELLVGADAAAELAALDHHALWERGADRCRFVGAAADLAATMRDWAQAGATDGFVVLPARLPLDLDRFVAHVVPELGRAGVFRAEYAGAQLRNHFELARPANRYAATP